MTENIALLKLDDLNKLMAPSRKGAQNFYDYTLSRDKWIMAPNDRLDIIFTMIVVAVTLNSDNAESLFDDMISRFPDPVTPNERQAILKRIDEARGLNHD